MMSDITPMNLAAMDMNLFLVLQTVLDERSATRAAKRLNLTQSAVSNSLAKLRVLLKDPLFVRSGRGLSPTRRTTELAPHLKLAISELRTALGPKGPFNPKKSTRTFTVACADNLQIQNVPRIMAALTRQMPNARLRIVSVDYLIAKGGLGLADVDFVLGSRQAAKGMPFEALYREDGVAILRRKHPSLAKRISREVFNSAKHIDVLLNLGESGGGRNAFERLLEKNGLHRRVVLTVPSFAAAAIAAGQSDYVACLPRQAAEVFARHFSLRIAELPVRESYLDVGLIRHQRMEDDPETGHFRKAIIGALSDDSVKCPVPR